MKNSKDIISTKIELKQEFPAQKQSEQKDQGIGRGSSGGGKRRKEAWSSRVYLGNYSAQAVQSCDKITQSHNGQQYFESAIENT
jgi:hypothetical protein